MSSQYPGSLHNHSQFSNLRLRDSINRTAEMMEYAIELGHTTLGITEHETISNAIKIEKEYKKIKEKHPEFKLIRGNEIYLCRDGLTGQNFERGKDRYFHFILLAKDAIGHQQIRELSTRAWNRSWMNGKMRRVPTYYQDLIDIIGAAPGHVIGSTACLGGFLDTKLLQWAREGRNDQFYQQIINWVKQMEGIFGKDYFYLEMQPSANDEQECANRELFNLSEITGIPYIITTDSHYLKKADAPIHKAFLNSQEGDREVDSFYATTYMMSTEELESYMSPYFTSVQLATAYSNIEKIRDMCEDYSLLRPLKIPSLPWGGIPQISQIEYNYWIKRIPYLQKFINSTFDGDRAMAALVVDKLKSDKRLQYQDCYKELNENLEMTWVSSEKNNTHWSAYFLNLRGVLDACSEAGSIVGPGRGSGVGFLLLYMLDLIQINPLWETTHTFSWRFLNPDRVSVLDIDTDIEGGKRAQALQALRNKYGQDRVANVVTFGTEASKSAIQTACFESDVLVNTVDGLKKINKLKKGDRIYTSNGIEEILETTSRDFSGDIYEIHNDFNINPIRCTENHQFLIYPQGRVKQTFGNSICNYNRCQLFDPQNNFIKDFISNIEACRYYADIYTGSFSSMKRNKRHNGYYIKNIEANEIKNGEIQWLTADKIKKTDKLLSYIDLSVSKEFPLINFPKEEQNPHKKYCNYIKEQILIDNELCELLGIYLAEGNINAELRGITFTINQKEEEFAERIIYLLQHCFGISKTNISILNKKDSLGLSIQVNSTPLGNFIWRYFNDNQKRLANDKQIPNKFKFLPPEKQLYIVKGFYLGDGYSRKRNNGSFETKLTTISPQLALDLWQILARNKCKSTCISENRQKNNENKNYNIMIYGINSELLYNIKYLQQIEQPIEIKEKTEYLCYENKYYYTSNILSIEKIKENIQEKVYCLSVPSQHFVLNNIITHNCRGLGIDVDTALYIASLVPADRGIQRTLKQCYYGDEEYAAIPLFIQQMNMYPELWEVAQKIEGLISRVGEHAGGVIFVDEPFTNSTALMKVPNGDTVTQFDLHDCEDASLIKIDLLSVEALDKIHVCLDLLSDQGYIERENTLRETYEKYLGIYNIEREDPSMWNMVWNHEIQSLFQMNEQSGIQGIALTHPSSVDDFCVLNSVIRLMAPDKDAEQPLNKYARFKEDKSLWYDEMDRYGLTEEEQRILEPIVGQSYGICESQEKFMQLVQTQECGGFNLMWADRLRKSIAKKNPAEYEQLTKEYFENADKKGLSRNLCNYVWHVLVATSRGYGFNASHTLAYSLVGLQEMNLAYRFPTIFWNCACLITDSGGAEDEDEAEIVDIYEPEDFTEYEYIDAADKQTKTKKRRSNNYGKIATAIGKMRAEGINVTPPDINTSQYTFYPDVENNRILFGLRGLLKVGDDIIAAAIENRPYSSPRDFMTKTGATKSAMISLIKAGAFDSMIDRKLCMGWYLWEVCDKKNNLTLQNMAALMKYDLLPKDNNSILARRVYEFNRYLKAITKTSKAAHYILDTRALEFLREIECDDLIIADNSSWFIDSKKWDKVYQKYMDIFREWLTKNKIEVLKELNSLIFKEEWNKYAKGTISAWEMEVMGFYHHEHELARVDNDKYGFVNYFDLPEDPIVERSFYKGGKEIKIFKLSKICGTCIAKNKQKGLVTLLTPTGVVTVKLNKEHFAMYDKQISERREDGTKRVVERSWFGRGTMIVVQGLRSGDQFRAKKYASSGGGHQLYKITEVFPNGEIALQTERYQGGYAEDVIEEI